MADIKTDEHIGRAALLKRIEASPLVKNYLMLRGSQTLINGILDLIKRQPADDVSEVIKCKDCKNWGGVTFGNVCSRWSAPLAGMKNCTKPDDFCSYGERKVDNG